MLHDFRSTNSNYQSRFEKVYISVKILRCTFVVVVSERARKWFKVEMLMVRVCAEFTYLLSSESDANKNSCNGGGAVLRNDCAAHFYSRELV